MSEESKPKYYSLTNILKRNAQYNIIFGERSNGKTFAALQYMIHQYATKGEQGALIRRFKEDFRGKRGAVMFDAITAAGVIKKETGGQWDRVYSYAGRWYFAKYDPIHDKVVQSTEPFCYGFSLSDMEHDKSTSYPKITTIVFDEFLTRQFYLPDEFVLFMNVVSTIVRQRDNVKIFMLGNTVNQYCPYFKEMGLTHITEMKKGSIEVYQYGESKLKVAVEYATSITDNGKPSDVYFAFDNPKLHMITGGAWEMAMYPHRPVAYKPKDVVFSFFLDFNQNILQGDVVYVNDMTFIFIHRKTTPIKSDNDLVYSFDDVPSQFHIRNMRKSKNKLNMKIVPYFRENKVFYQDNEVGEIVRNYLVECMHDAVQ